MSEPTREQIDRTKQDFWNRAKRDGGPEPSMREDRLDPDLNPEHEPEPEREPEKGPRKLSAIDADDIGDDTEAPDQIVEDLLAIQQVCDLYGASQAGKTTIAVWLSICVALGLDFLGKRTRPGAVVYVAAESPANVMRRIQAAKRFHKLKSMPLTVIREPVDLFDTLADMAALAQFVLEYGARVGEPVRLIVLDTLACSIGDSDENSTKDANKFMRTIKLLALATGASIALIHHTGKNAERGARGSSVIYSNADAELACEYDEALDVRIVTVRKQRDLGTEGERVAARFERVTLGADSWGKPLTASVAVTVELPTLAGPKAKGPRLTDRARNALRIFDHLLAENGEALAATSICPPGKRGVRVEAWRDRYVYVYPPEADADPRQAARNRDSKRREFSRARDALTAKGVLATSGEWVWKA